jgi:putative Mg2+ transporter-C (MgtC) family protein
MPFELFGPTEIAFVFAMVLSLILGFLIGAEREARGKDAGISTHVLVIAGAALFTQLSAIVDPMSTSRIAAQIVSGIGFLGAGLILKEGASVKNLTTAASLWVAGAIGMAIGFGFYVVAVLAAVVSMVAPRIPHLHKRGSVE